MRIVLALDGSTESLAATNFLAKLPWRKKPSIVAVTALVDSPYDLVPTDTGLWLREAEKEAAFKNYESAKSILEPVCGEIEQVVEREHPRQLIMDVAERIDADLIVLGARGHSVAYRATLGSTADHVANHGRCSVLIVRKHESGAWVESDRGDRILLAYDGSQESKTAYEDLCQFDWPKAKTRVHLATLLDRPKLLPEDATYDPEKIAECEKMLAKLSSPDKLSCEVEQSVRETTHVGNGIHLLAETLESNLIFIGGTGKSAVMRFFLGSTSRYVLHHASCSLWIGREKQWN